ncbi:uncharacterized protein LOC8266303 isoform X2 [Ricinus communis]|uniref:uncharacterized protein LOC8266303 isoform X2 n=1 Tax=Ricinus communis TaxID=3988 RepID=UPI0007724D3C|nr:uncharacterized protein LOC8266303 isoform X2 [Ricinus communis]|eukprot:XP_002529973.2 uncharacterized protein LOC8266303 isoform X2 [Ricinus communis]
MSTSITIHWCSSLRRERFKNWVWMGTNGEEKHVSGHLEQEPKKILKACVACLWSFLVSVAGGLLLGYWEYEYHLTSSQLWMVPLGLILLITPPVVWFALIVSEICNSSKEDDDTKMNRTITKSAPKQTETSPLTKKETAKAFISCPAKIAQMDMSLGLQHSALPLHILH